MTERSRFWDGTTIGDASAVAPYDAATEFATVLMALAATAHLADKGGVWGNVLGGLAVSSPAANTARVGSGAALNYGSWYDNDANVDFTIPTPGASTRVDRIVLRKGWVAQTVRATKIAGVEGAGTPAMTQSAGTTWDIPLALVSITTGGVITVTDVRVLIEPVNLGDAQSITGVKSFINGLLSAGGIISNRTATDATDHLLFSNSQAGGGTTRVEQHTYTQTAIAGVAKIIALVDSTGAGVYYVMGSDGGGNEFHDVVNAGHAGTPGVISSVTIAGAPSARTYVVSGGALQLSMASGTYTTRTTWTAHSRRS